VYSCSREAQAVGLFVLKRNFFSFNADAAQQETEEFQVTYALRVGIEGTHSQDERALGLHQVRHIGLQKASWQHALIATTINLLRIDNFITRVKTAKTRTSHFAALAPKEAA
jgi:transposase